jgi:hypothetical protein
MPQRSDPIADEEVVGWFREVMPEGRTPSVEHLAPLIVLVRSHHQFRLRTQHYLQVQRTRGPTATELPSPGLAGEALDHAYALRSALDELSVLGHGFWMGMGVSPHRVANLRTALVELGPYLRPRPAPQRGPKGSSESWNEFAELYAGVVASALRAAGMSHPSEERANGPVARIGVKAIKRVFQGAPRIEKLHASSFASAVRAVRRAREKAQKAAQN